jgi:hypothetical protein
MTHQRLLNECCEHLARRALSIVAARLPLEDHQTAYIELAGGLLGYEMERERMEMRLGTKTGKD